MGQYGINAIEATKLLNSGYKSAEQAWRKSAEILISKESSREKPCPRSAFLGLCAAGLVVGVSPNTVKLMDSKNGNYAVKAVELLVANHNLARQGKTKLWKQVMSELKENPNKKQNGQMDVVMTLWEKNLIIVEST
ncbi:hypothetical protein H6G74_22400 [Nostoc spongiaeforme FACHB-130]|uniref:Uncharacterized protein n=1 Tax=Nostoc spongiaeforme FACHB-130 TaxID=1357510 RepID=A0ABR8G1K8_9NOSO|nr:hypothetical protein [Nostoc spongiaeforme]MBD2597057.1 hypothetical protein [Nostoc spongiaeforme FACHB-130]